MHEPASTAIVSLKFNDIAVIIGDSIFSSWNALIQIKVLVYVSSKPAIAVNLDAVPGKLDDESCTKPPFIRYLSSLVMITVYHT